MSPGRGTIDMNDERAFRESGQERHENGEWEWRKPEQELHKPRQGNRNSAGPDENCMSPDKKFETNQMSMRRITSDYEIWFKGV